MLKNTGMLLSMLLLSYLLCGQSVYTIKSDSIKITNCNPAELIIENHTQNVPGFLFNVGNGRTQFRRGLNKISDTSYIIGSDTLKIAPPTSVWQKNGNAGTIPGNNFLGTIDSISLVFKTKNIEAARFTAGGGNFLLGSPTDNGQKLQVTGNSSFSGAITQNSLSPRTGTGHGINHIQPAIQWDTNFISGVHGQEINTYNQYLQNTTINTGAYGAGNILARMLIDARANYPGGDSITIRNFPPAPYSFLPNISAYTDMNYSAPYTRTKINGGIAGVASILNINGSPTITTYADFISQGTFSSNPIGEHDSLFNRMGLFVPDLKADSTANIFIGNTYPIFSIGAKDVSYVAGNFIIGGGAPPVSNGAKLQVNGSETISSNIGIGGVSPISAKVHIAAGTATAGTAPLKLSPGTILTTPENGAIEYGGFRL